MVTTVAMVVLCLALSYVATSFAADRCRCHSPATKVPPLTKALIAAAWSWWTIALLIVLFGIEKVWLVKLAFLLIIMAGAVDFGAYRWDVLRIFHRHQHDRRTPSPVTTAPE